MKRIIYISAATLALTSCGLDVDEVLLQRNDISLTIKGEPQMSFNENTCQLGYNTDRNEFRVYDEKLANWFIVSCSVRPTSEGQEVTADLEYTTPKDTKRLHDLELEVMKVSTDGLVWMWENDKKIGIVVKSL